MSASWVFRYQRIDLDFGIQVVSVKQRIERNSAGPGHVTHRRTSAFENHLDYRFIILKKCKARRQNEKVLRL